MNLSDSGRTEQKANISTPLPGSFSSSAAPDLSRESNSNSVIVGNSLEISSDTSAVCREDAAAASSTFLEDSAYSAPSNHHHHHHHHHTGKRKRRRNSGKMEQPANHSTPVGKPGIGGERSSDSRNSFHTPRSGAKTGPGPRHQNHSHPRHQGKGKQKKFQYGNYNKYYGYRNPGCSEDLRVRVFQPEWFEGKDVLDLGCNTGHLTLYIAKVLRPANILGLDIDGSLVHAARKNIRHYLSELQTHEARRGGWTATAQERRNKGETRTEEQHSGENEKGEGGAPAETRNDKDSRRSDETGNRKQSGKTEQESRDSTGQTVSCSFPVSLRISRGPIAAPPLTETSTAKPGEFPSNVSFIKANYVLDSDDLLLTQRPEYDVILCLSVTKWVHLNWGDSGLQRFFKRAYKHLRPGGLFILEPQPWESYVRRKKLTDNITRNFHSIRLKPDMFSSYLINEVGFSSFEHLGAPKCSVRGFQRPIYLFHK